MVRRAGDALSSAKEQPEHRGKNQGDTSDKPADQ
jgi:hypothetical protein